jgi:hypothetical protein
MAMNLPPQFSPVPSFRYAKVETLSLRRNREQERRLHSPSVFSKSLTRQSGKHKVNYYDNI